jgi:tripeptidyl-peptidase-1
LLNIPELYDIPLGTKAAPNNSVAIFGYGDYYNQTDLDNFFKLFAEFVPQGTSPKVNFINGAEQYAREIDGEESLDLMMAYPIAYPGKVEIYQMPYSDLNGMANDFLDAVDASYCDYDGGDDPENDRQYPAFLGFQGPRMCGTYNAPKVLSISFAKDESALPRHYVERQCREWMKLALQGVTVLVSAGDRGVSGNFGCVVNTETAGQSSFNPLFPGTCPYVTTVGATQVNFTGKRLQEVSVYDKPHNYWSGGTFDRCEF